MMVPKTAQELVNAIKKTKYSLNRWERDFVNTIEQLITDDRHLSDGRSSMLQKIYRKANGG